MKTTAYEKMTDEELSARVAVRVMGWEHIEWPHQKTWMWDCGPQEDSDGKIYATFKDKLPAFATSLDACREAIEKFNCYSFRLTYEYQLKKWFASILTSEDWMFDDCGEIMIEHKNPARACSIVMLMAMEKE